MSPNKFVASKKGGDEDTGDSEIKGGDNKTLQHVSLTSLKFLFKIKIENYH